MPRGVVDLEGLKSPPAEALRRMAPPAGLPFQVRKLGHVVLKVKDVKRSVAFYTGVLGFRVSDVYPESMMKGGMVFLRCNADHHCLEMFWGLDHVGSDDRSRPPEEWRDAHSLEDAARSAPPGQDTTLFAK